MKDFVIRAMEFLVWVVGALVLLGGILAGVAFMSQGQMQGLAFIIGAPIYAIMLCGGFFVAIGIYYNTKRMADAMEKQGTFR